MQLYVLMVKFYRYRSVRMNHMSVNSKNIKIGDRSCEKNIPSTNILTVVALNIMSPDGCMTHPFASRRLYPIWFSQFSIHPVLSTDIILYTMSPKIILYRRAYKERKFTSNTKIKHWDTLGHFLIGNSTLINKLFTSIN